MREIIQIFKPKYCSECKKKLGLFGVNKLEVYKYGKKVSEKTLCEDCLNKWLLDFYEEDASERRDCGNCYWLKIDSSGEYYCLKKKEWLEPEMTARINEHITKIKYSQAKSCKWYIHCKEYKIKKRARARMLLVECEYCGTKWNLKDTIQCPNCGARKYKEIT